MANSQNGNMQMLAYVCDNINNPPSTRRCPSIVLVLAQRHRNVDVDAVLQVFYVTIYVNVM